jgi:hypothetical protein
MALRTAAMAAALALTLAMLTGCVPAPTPIPPTPTALPTVTPLPPTATAVPPTATRVPPTSTAVPPTATPRPSNTATARPTSTAVPPTATRAATATRVPPTPAPRPTNTPPSSKYPLPAGKGGLVVRNWYGDTMDFTIANQTVTIQPSGETFIVLDPGNHSWTAHIAKYGWADGAAQIVQGQLTLQQFAAQ